MARQNAAAIQNRAEYDQPAAAAAPIIAPPTTWPAGIAREYHVMRLASSRCDRPAPTTKTGPTAATAAVEMPRMIESIA